MREAALGAGVALVIFVVAQGVNLLPLALLGALVLFLWRASPMRSLTGKVAAGQIAPATGIKFDDIGGQQTAKKELLEALDFLVERCRLQQMGIRPLRGILLTGPPGTGKTLLAKAAAGHTGSAFFAASGSEFIEMYAGVGAQRVRDLFKRARDKARKEGRDSAIIFIDELEVLGGKRGQHASHLEYDQTLNQLLVEMDGLSFDDDVVVLVIGATNRADLLDGALTRPGRFDRTVAVDLPDREGRLHILSIHTRNKPVAPDFDLEAMAEQTFGFSGAQLESLTNEAAILAMRQGVAEICQAHFTEALDKVILGEKIERRPRPEERRRVAVHEAGHAVVAEWVQPGSVATVTVVPRGQAMGYVRSHQEDRYLYTLSMLQARLCVALAGAAAEELLLGEMSTGARGDFDQAVQLSRQIIAAGMSDLGIVDPERPAADAERRVMGEILRREGEAVRRYLEQHQSTLATVAGRLETEETIDGKTLRCLLAATDATAGRAS